MPTLYEYLADSTRAKYPLEALDPKVAKFLGTEVPASYSQAKLARIVGLAERGVARFARSGGAPEAATDRAAAGALARRPGVDYASAAAALQGRLSPFGDGEAPEAEPATYATYRRQGPIARVGMRLAQQAYPFVAGVPRMLEEFGEWQSGMNIPDKTPSHVDIVPPAATGAERATDVAGSVLGFTGATAAGGYARLPGLAALGLAGALPEEGGRNRVIAAGTTMAAGQASHALGGAIAPAGANLARQAGSGVVGAVAFGAGEPTARTLTQRLTGNPDYPAPTLQDIVGSTLELGAVNALGLLGAAALTRGRSRATVIGPERQLPPARAPKSRQLAAAPAEPGAAREMPGDPNAAPGAVPVARRLPAGPAGPSGEPILMGAGETPAQRRAPVLEKLAPEFAADRRLVAAGRTVADVFAEMVEAEAGKGETRAEWKAAVRKVVASGRIQAVQDIAAALSEPGGASRRAASPELRAREQRFAEELNARAAGRTLTLNIDGEPTKLRIARVAVFRYPGEERPVRVVVEDVANGRLLPLRFRNVAELSQAANNPQALVKSEDVFARAERQRGVQKPPVKAAGAGGPEATPAAATKAAAPAAPAEAEVLHHIPPPGGERRVGERLGPLFRKDARGNIVGKTGRKSDEMQDRSSGPKLTATGGKKPIPAKVADEYVAKFVEGYKALHEKVGEKGRAGVERHLESIARESADATDRRAAAEALQAIRGGTGGSATREGGTGRQAPPPAPAPERKRTAIGMEFSDPKQAQRVADAMNKTNPDVEAAVVIRRGKPAVEVNEDAAVEPPKAKPTPKAEPAAAPAAPEKKVAAESAADAGRPAGGLSEPPAAPAAKPKEVARFGKYRVEQREMGELGTRFVVATEKGDFSQIFTKLEEAAAFAKRFSDNDSRRAGAKPEESAVDPVADEAALEAASKFKRGERVMAPNEGAAHNDLRDRVKGRIVGWERGADGESHVRVQFMRGKTGFREAVVPEASLGRLRDPERVLANQRAEQAKLAASMEKKAGGSAAKARALQRELEAKAEATYDALEKKLAAKREAEPRINHENTEWYARARSAQKESWKRYMRAAEVAEELHGRLVKERLGGREALHPEIEPFFQREEAHADWVEPLREVAEDFPEHFTHERQARYLHRAATLEVANAVEWKAAIDFERGMAERGVSPEHAAYATEATERIRRVLEQDADNPLVDAVDIEAARARWLSPEHVDSPEALAKTTKEFEAENPRGPADDIPAGVMPEPPEGFAADLKERGMARAEILAPWLWLKHLREIPRAFARARRNIPRRQRQYTIYDASGNVLERGEHALYEPDYYSESALTRLLSWAKIEPGAHVLTPELRSSYKASISDHARIKSEWRFHLVAKLGPELAQKLRAYSKRSMQLDRVLEGLAPESSLPADIRPAVQVFKDWYAERWEIIKKEARDLGEPEPTSKLEGRYVGPRLILGHISKTVESMFSDLLGEGRVTPEITEARNRFLHERTGDPVYREDAMYRAGEYIDTMSRYLAHRRFFKEVKEFVQENRLTDHHRVGAIINLLKATLMRKKNWFERTMDTALAHIRYAKAPPDIREESLESAAHLLKTTVEQLKKGSGLERVFVVPKGAKFRVGGDAKSFDLATLKNGATLVGTGGAHLFGEMPVLWKPEAALKRKALRARVAKLSAQEAANKKLTGEEGGYLSPFFSKDEHVQMMFDEWRDSVLRSRNDLTAAAFRGMGDRLTRAVLGNNLRAVLQNSMQPWLTLAPEIGYRRTLQAIIENSLGGKRGKLMAEMTGSLQGELARTEELMQPGSWFRRVNDAFGPMSGYKYAEDFTRGVGMIAGEIMGRRMGLPPGVAMDLSGEINPRFFEDWRSKTEAMRKGGTVENLQATLDTETMYDYNMLGQSPIFGGAMGKLFGRLMTFPGRYFRRGVTRPLGGAAKVARALVLGGADRATGGALKAAGMPVGAAGKFRRGYEARGKYAGPANAFEEFLDYYGARAHDRQGARVLLRQIQGMGVMAGIAAATGLNAFIVGTPGWERVPLLAILSFIPPGTVLHERVKKLLDTTQRSAVTDPERGVESTMSPLIRTGYTLVKEQPQAWGAAYRKAVKGDPAGAATALSKPLTKALSETGRQMFIPSLVAVRRLFQQMPMAEPFFKSDAGKAFAHLMGIKTYIKGNGAWGFVKGTLGLAPVVEEEKRRVRVDEPPKKSRTRSRSRDRGSIYSSVLGMGEQGAFA